MRSDDVLIVGAGPSGAIAALVLARAGARVRIVDRATFPRDKLCGDTLNPGTLALLRRLGVAGPIEASGLTVEGMRVTGDNGVVIEGRYPGALRGRAIVRRELDWRLLQAAIAAGAEFVPAVAVERPIVDEGRSALAVVGVVARAGGTMTEWRARAVIAADGRRSTVVAALGLARHPRWPRRWAIGAYYDGVGGVSDVGEMHIRHARYIGVAPVPGGLTNVCVVQPWRRGEAPFDAPAALVDRAVTGDRLLRERFVAARLVTPPVVLGPLAVDVVDRAIDGLLLAGDASGFIDPMTGDGLRFAVRGGELAAVAALEALDGGWTGVHERLAIARRREFRSKWRFNRTLRALVASAPAVRAAAAGARVAPSIVRRLIARAGDCDLV